MKVIEWGNWSQWGEFRLGGGRGKICDAQKGVIRAMGKRQMNMVSKQVNSEIINGIQLNQ